MLAKGLLVTVLATTPLCLVATQDPEPARSPAPSAAQQQQQQQQQQDAQRALDATQRELQRAQHELADLRRQLGELLDRLECEIEPEQPQHGRNCSPSRSQALLTHYQWLQKNGHGDRAGTTLAKVVERSGNDVNRLNSQAWELMTGKENVGRFDDVALALANRMVELSGGSLRHQHLDTLALACFLNGDLEQAVTRQQEAIAQGGDSDDYRRRLRTYEAARAQLDRAAHAGELAAAGGDD